MSMKIGLNYSFLPHMEKYQVATFKQELSIPLSNQAQAWQYFWVYPKM